MTRSTEQLRERVRTLEIALQSANWEAAKADLLCLKELLVVREAQSKPADLYLCRVTRGGEELYSPCGKDYPRGRGYYTAPPAPALLDAVDYSDLDATSQDREVIEAIAECRGWNAYRAAMLNHVGDSTEKVPDDWIEHDGNGYPSLVKRDAMLFLKTRKQEIKFPYPAGLVKGWCHIGRDTDILAYKLASPTPTNKQG